MEIMKFLRICKFSFITLLIAVLASCELIESVDCGECYTEAPVEATIYVKINEKYIIGAGILIEIYGGDYEDKILIDSFTLRYPSETPIKLPINKRYTFTAKYSVEGKSYITFDETTLSVKFSSDECEDSCYFVYGDTVDLRLKYITQ